jgi:hypothetical protein
MPHLEMVRSILLSIFGLLYFACQSQIISQSGRGINILGKIDCKNISCKK